MSAASVFLYQLKFRLDLCNFQLQLGQFFSPHRSTSNERILNKTRNLYFQANPQTSFEISLFVQNFTEGANPSRFIPTRYIYLKKSPPDPPIQVTTRSSVPRVKKVRVDRSFLRQALDQKFLLHFLNKLTARARCKTRRRLST